MTQPVFRFAPSPNGPLHLGHAYSAMLNHDLAADAGGRFLLRIEDIDIGRSTADFFQAGRSLPWWVVGTSMVATTFAADTPLAITEMVRGQGIWRNWWWWNLALGGMLGVVFFSRLWRRAEVLTDNELIELRYAGRPAAVLRAFKAGWFATVYNFIVMGWVINGMSTVIGVLMLVWEHFDRWDYRRLGE